MDTRFWGPSAWKMLHSLASVYPDRQAADKDYGRFFRLLPKVLPCCYCRDSLKEYYKVLPFPSQPDQKRLSRWLYNIHNRVNQKLRNQGNPVENDPSFTRIIKKYSPDMIYTYLDDIWDFIYSIGLIECIKYINLIQVCQHYQKQRKQQKQLKRQKTNLFEFIRSLQGVLVYLYPNKTQEINSFTISTHIQNKQDCLRELYRLEQRCHIPTLSLSKRIHRIREYHVG